MTDGGFSCIIPTGGIHGAASRSLLLRELGCPLNYHPMASLPEQGCPLNYHPMASRGPLSPTRKHSFCRNGSLQYLPVTKAGEEHSDDPDETEQKATGSKMITSPEYQLSWTPSFQQHAELHQSQRRRKGEEKKKHVQFEQWVEVNTFNM
eukprot:CAMPEP_0206380732 /NCGR_PEP_ID=MMETSP0294-20121207/12206_1 /ASSEMBLY_ACC=CAM_ASM_000327 /TAXON_ID=39354 /ORGANISM="Heterosigma akashiwo, Strain CCMP2393" /LENGTH=149 /DNA_ID=CAMNT_0053830011 /DNA_START=164 /DNA_END=613 /DNA_ORIENTATION=-